MAEKVMHGPMWQFECKTCNYMGDCWDTEREAAEEMQNHKCDDKLPSWAREEMKRLRAAGDRLAAAVNAVSCSGPRDEMAELTDAFLDWEGWRG